MNFFRAETMSAPLLEIPSALWPALVDHLRARSAGVEESGGFLLGHKTETGRAMTRFLPYEELQHDALRGDHVHLSAASFARLWELCRAENLSVVADVHVHGGSALQSRSDRENPMVAIPGHIAFIVPRFARGQVRLRDVLMYVYQGNHQWAAYWGSDIERRVRLTPDGDTQ